MNHTPQFQHGFIRLADYTIWKQKRLRELKHQLHGYCPAMRLERITFLPFGYAIEYIPSAYRAVWSDGAHPWMRLAAKLIYSMQKHFGLEDTTVFSKHP